MIRVSLKKHESLGLHTTSVAMMSWSKFTPGVMKGRVPLQVLSQDSRHFSQLDHTKEHPGCSCLSPRQVRERLPQQPFYKTVSEKNTGVYKAIVRNFALNIPKNSSSLNTPSIVSIGKTTQERPQKRKNKTHTSTTEICVH